MSSVAEQFAELAESVRELEDFRARLCTKPPRFDRQWRAQAISRGLRIERLRAALDEAARALPSDNNQWREKIARRCWRLLAEPDA